MEQHLPYRMEQELNDLTGGTLKTGHEEQLVNAQEVEGTPFHIITHDNKHFLSIGNIRLSESYDTIEKLFNWMEFHHWDLILKLILAMPHLVKDFANFQQETIQNQQNQTK